jgi:serine/threonine protein phosphatase 1
VATIAVGDIHGHLCALIDLLDEIRGECGAGDTVVFLGDYIDRGPSSKQCVDALLQFQRESAAEVVCLLGNHEEWMLQTMRDHRRHSWLLGMEAFDTIRSYSAGAEAVVSEAARGARMALYLEQAALPYEAFFDSMPPEHVRFFEGLRSYHRTAECVCSHGGLDPDVAMVDEQPPRALTWGVRGFPERYHGGAMVVYGHWNNAAVAADGWPHPLMIGNTIGIDTIAWGVLTAVRLPGRRVFQSARYNPVGERVGERV